MAQQRRDHLHGVGPGHHRLHGVRPVWTPPVDRERALDLAREDREPAQAQQQLARAREVERRDDLELLDVDVGLVEAVEEDEAVGARVLEPPREMRRARSRTARA